MRGYRKPDDNFDDIIGTSIPVSQLATDISILMFLLSGLLAVGIMALRLHPLFLILAAIPLLLGTVALRRHNDGFLIDLFVQTLEYIRILENSSTPQKGLYVPGPARDEVHLSFF